MTLSGTSGNGIGNKSRLRFEITSLHGSDRVRVEVWARVADTGASQVKCGPNPTRWERIGTIQTHRETWEWMEAVVVLGVESGVGVEIEEERKGPESESEWARARRLALEVSANKSAGKELGQ